MHGKLVPYPVFEQRTVLSPRAQRHLQCTDCVKPLGRGSGLMFILKDCKSPLHMTETLCVTDSSSCCRKMHPIRGQKHT